MKDSVVLRAEIQNNSIIHIMKEGADGSLFHYMVS